MVGELELGAGDLPDPAVVMGVRVRVALAQEGVAQQVADGVGRPDGGDDTAELEVARQAGVAAQRVRELLRLGAEGETGDDARPARVARQPVERRQDVLAQGAADAGVLELDLLLLEDAADVADGPGQDLRVRVDAVSHGHGARQVPRQGHQRGVHRDRLDAGHHQQTGPHRAAP